MRPLHLDITGTTDSSGNASIPVKLPQTGEWHDVKFSLSLPAPAEWAILVSGRPATYGRGRRVTLGPELIQDGETVTVNVSGGPPNAAIDGAARGKSGDAGAILAGFTPQPNTIALDTSAQQVLLGSLTTPGDGAQHTKIIPMQPNTQGVGYFVRSGAAVLVSMLGTTTNFLYFSLSPVTWGKFNAFPFGDPLDTQVQVAVTDNGSPATVDFISWSYDPVVWTRQEPNTFQQVQINDLNQNIIGSDGGTVAASLGQSMLVSMIKATPAPWQSGVTSVTMSANFVGGTPQQQVAGVAGELVYVHDVFIVANAACNVTVRSDTTHKNIAQGSANAAGVALDWDGHGRQAPVGEGIEVLTSANAGLNGTIGFTQQ